MKIHRWNLPIPDKCSISIENVTYTNSLVIEVLSSGKSIQLTWNRQVVSFRVINESFCSGWFAAMPEIGKSRFFILESAPSQAEIYGDLVLQEMTKNKPLFHYVLVGEDDVVEVISMEEPVVIG